MFDTAFKAVTNLKLPTVQQPKKETSGLLSRNVTPKTNSNSKDVRQTVAKYVQQIRNRRKAYRDGTT
mgnify:CR=1 FL=1|tara:strand:+ start:1120 stop:1320 length:201 start_codon:yes stop_codon:yes gene_type:complete